MSLKVVIVMCGLALVLSGQPTVAGQLEDGVAAYKRGDYATAFRLVEPLALRGDAGAQRKLGLMYLTGLGAPQSDLEAFKWYKLSAEQGDVVAIHSIGQFYSLGTGVRRDTAEAAKWFRLAAEKGYAEAQHQLGLMHGLGEGVPVDHVEALKWYRRAADQCFARAQIYLGLAYDYGEGVTQSFVQAHRWFNLASICFSPDQAGRNSAIKYRDQVTKKMTNDQIAEAQRLALQWLTSHSKP